MWSGKRTLVRKNEGQGNGYGRYRNHILRRALPCTPPDVAGLFSAGYLTEHRRRGNDDVPGRCETRLARSGGRSPDRQWYAVEQQGLHWCVTPALASPAPSWIKLEIVEDSGRRMTFVLRRRELIRQTSRQSSPSLTDRTGPGSSLRLLARTLFP